MELEEEKQKALYDGPTYFDLIGKNSIPELIEIGRCENITLKNDQAFKLGLEKFKNTFERIPVRLINQRNKFGRTAFAECMVKNPQDNIRLVDCLIKAGANTNTMDLSGYKANMLLLRSNLWDLTKDMVYLLLRSGIEINNQDMVDLAKDEKLPNDFYLKHVRGVKAYIEEIVKEEKQQLKQ